MTTGILEQGPINSSYTSSGQSDDAKRLEGQVRGPLIRLEDPVEYVEPYRSVHMEMDELFVECLEDDWDGYGAKGVSFASYDHAREFVLALPLQWLDLEVGVDPDGEFSFDWIGDRGSTLSVSIGPNGQLSYAGRFGCARTHGLEPFSQSIPRGILHCLERLT